MCRCYCSDSDDKKGADKLASLLGSLKKSEVERKKAGEARASPDKEVHQHLHMHLHL